jgi:uncharacterized caspase-like protein
MFRYLALMIAFCTFLTNAAFAEKRVALVIGNSNYSYAQALPNPTNDATAITQSLTRLGFDVISGTNLSHDKTRLIVKDFARALKDADVALFFFAGHGIQVEGKNYLIPVDGSFEDGEADLDFSAIDVDFVLRQMERSAATRILLLDACRNNPFETQLSRAMGQSRAVNALGKGLAPIENTGGALMAFATLPGEIAYDGIGKHSPFTSALLTHLETPGLEINRVMTRVRADVNKSTQGRQLPWTSSVLLQDVFLSPKSQPKLDPTAEDIAAWQGISNSKKRSDFETYLTRFPNGLFKDFAQRKIDEITTTPVILTVAPQPLLDTSTPEPFLTLPNEDPTLEGPNAGTFTVFPDIIAPLAIPVPPPDTLALIQAQLNRLGCNAGTVDGQWGRNSDRALGRYTDALGLPSYTIEGLSYSLVKDMEAHASEICEIVIIEPVLAAPKKTKRKRNCFTFNGARVCE